MIIDSFLSQIEKYVFGRKNFELFYEVLTKEKDESFQFRNMIDIANQNIENMFSKFDNVDFKRMAEFCIKQDGMVIRKEITKCDSDSSSECKSKA